MPSTKNKGKAIRQSTIHNHIKHLLFKFNELQTGLGKATEKPITRVYKHKEQSKPPQIQANMGKTFVFVSSSPSQ
jgi:hypothetical protein